VVLFGPSLPSVLFFVLILTAGDVMFALRSLSLALFPVNPEVYIYIYIYL
jgi:hypothetical protein